MPSKLLEELGWHSPRHDIPGHLPNLIHTDSRTVQPGQWFVPIAGPNFDAHSFIPEALAKGAQGFLYSQAHRTRLPAELLALGIEVDETTHALQQLGAWWRRQSPGRIVGITGSSGKTSVKELTYAMLQAIGPTLKTVGSLNNEVGVPLTLCQLRQEHRFAVIEMGARHQGDIAFLGEMVAQDVGVLLNVGTAHIGEFGGSEHILRTKMEIARAPQCVYFRDDESIHQAMQELSARTFKTFGFHPEADVRIARSDLNGNGELNFSVHIEGSAHRFRLPYYHESYPLNVASALAIGLTLGLRVEQCIPGLQTFRGVKGRFQVHLLDSLTLIDDAYNANPQSMKAGLDTLARAYSNYSKTLILGDMKELGELGEEAHRSIGRYCAEEVLPSRLVTVGPMGRWIADSARDAGMKDSQLSSFDDVDELLPHLEEICKDSQLLYVKASNSLRLSKIIDKFLSK